MTWALSNPAAAQSADLFGGEPGRGDAQEVVVLEARRREDLAALRCGSAFSRRPRGESSSSFGATQRSSPSVRPSRMNSSSFEKEKRLKRRRKSGRVSAAASRRVRK
ncbi:MAG: hypothetical protein MZV64_12670 [Ignavibacteriales bacterium]|nr:hypothetical protein [Ignavibacteriales bacterium]